MVAVQRERMVVVATCCEMIFKMLNEIVFCCC